MKATFNLENSKEWIMRKEKYEHVEGLGLQSRERRSLGHIGMRIASSTKLLAVLTAAGAGVATTAVAQEIAWMDQFAGQAPGLQDAVSVCAHQGDVYVLGKSSGALDDPVNAVRGAFLRKYSSTGEECWTRQLGAQPFEVRFPSGVAANTTGVYVSGSTAGSLSGQPHAGELDAFLRRYDGEGNELWTRQFGTSGWDRAWVVSLSDGGIFLTSSEGADMNLRRFDLDGNVLWTRPAHSQHITADVAGVINWGEEAGVSTVWRYDPDGEVLWSRAVPLGGQYGYDTHLAASPTGFYLMRYSWSDSALEVGRYTAIGDEVWGQTLPFPPETEIMDVAADASGFCVAGYTNDVLAGQVGFGGHDAFVRKYDGDGVEILSRQVGTSADDRANSVAIDGSGFYLTGSTGGGLHGNESSGGIDVFVVEYDLGGQECWTNQFGGLQEEQTSCSDIDVHGNVYVAGTTDGALPGNQNQGSSDAFLRKYSPEGSIVWTVQLGTQAGDYARSVVADATGVYACGGTSGDLTGGGNSGWLDVFVIKLDGEGNELWRRQFGSSASDAVEGAAADSSGVYVTGRTYGTLPGQTGTGYSGFVRKYAHDGTELWTHQWGDAAYRSPEEICVSDSGVFVTGWAYGFFGRSDVFLRKYEVDGTVAWTRAFGTPGVEEVRAVASAGGVVYVGGRSIGALEDPGTPFGAFVKAYDISGNELWARQFGPFTGDSVHAAFADESGVFVGGNTRSVLGGSASYGAEDAFVRRYNASGHLGTTIQFGTAHPDYLRGLVNSHLGLFVTGYTYGVFEGQPIFSGGPSAFVARLLGDVVAPTANAGVDLAIHAGQTVELDGRGSVDDVTATEYLAFHWELLHAPTGSGAYLTAANTARPSFAADTPGEYVIKLEVTDEAGNLSQPDTVLVSSLNLAPTAEAGPDTIVVVGSTVVLDGLDSADPDLDPIDFDWTLISSPPNSAAWIVDAATAMPSFTPDVVGRYVVELVVDDGFESSAPDSVRVMALPAATYAELRLVAATEILQVLDSSAFDATGHQHSLANDLASIADFLQKGNLSQAAKHLSALISRIDGYPVRGSVDPKGQGQLYPADFVTDPGAQLALYAELEPALNALLDS